MKFRYFLFLAMIIFSTKLEAQLNDSKPGKSLEQRIEENHSLMLSDPDYAILETDLLLEEAIKTNNKDAELSLLSRKSWFYIRKSDLKSALNEVQYLEKKATEYNDYYWQAYAHQYLVEIYALNNLQKKAISEFEKSLVLFDKSDRTKEDVNYAKGNLYMRMAIVYQTKEDFSSAKQMLQKTDYFFKSLSSGKKRDRALFFNYSNLGVVNYELKQMDSSEYYVKKSMNLADEQNKTTLAQMRNFLLMGKINESKKAWKEAYNYFKTAEQLDSITSSGLLEKSWLYHGLFNTYQALDSTQEATNYLGKYKDIEIQKEKNKNSSLHKIIDEELLKEKNYTVYVIIGSSVLVFILLVFIIGLYRKNKLLARQEILSEQYLEKHAEIDNVDEKTLSALVKMIEEKDPAFMAAFQNAFPSFLEKIQEIQPQVVPTELEFSALLKLNLTTKDIARFYNIEPKSVQNKKYRIRKKLNIPNEEDIYFWFSKI